MQVCKICSHNKRVQIDRELVAGNNMTILAKKYDVPYHSIVYHRDHHLTRQLVKHQELRELLSGQDLIQVVNDLLNASRDILEKTKDDPKRFGIALASIRETRETIRLLWETAIKLEEFKVTEQHQTRDGEIEKWRVMLDRLNSEERDQLVELYEKMSGKHPGERTDLKSLTPGPKPGARHPQAQHTIDMKRKHRHRRRKVPYK